jgi:uncharacterized protein YndB with AHSA1/START domain
MGRHSFTVRITAPPETVWGLWTDLDRAHEWIEGLTRITDVTGAPGTPGSSYTAWFGRMRSPTVVLEADPPRRLRTRFGSWLLRGEMEATFEPSDGGTRLTQEFRTEGIVPAISAWVFAHGSYRGSFKGELATFVTLAEREADSMDGDPADTPGPPT